MAAPTGGEGADQVYGGDGQDQILLEPDGDADEVWCGPGLDAVWYRPHRDRPRDALHDCELFGVLSEG